jgi:hypothetical protein
MRQILILKYKERDCSRPLEISSDKNFIINFSPTETYTILFDLDTSPRLRSMNPSGVLNVIYSNKELKVIISFKSKDDAENFRDALEEYLMSGSIPMKSEKDEVEIRHWLKLDVEGVEHEWYS